MRQFLAFSLLLMVAACGEPAKLSVENASINLPAVPGNPGSAYFTIKGGPRTETLISVTSPVVIRAEMHDSVTENGVMKMKPLAAVEVPSGGTIAFAPRGKHVMLYDIEPKAQNAGSITLTFTFASGAKLDAPAKVMKPGETASPDHGDHAH